MLTVVTGVSGSGKSTLVKKILYPAILKEVGGYGEKAGQFTKDVAKNAKVKVKLRSRCNLWPMCT